MSASNAARLAKPAAVPYRSLGSGAVLPFRGTSRPVRPARPNRYLASPWKRGIDVTGALVLLAILLPLLIVIAVLIRTTSRGPVLFRQTRNGAGLRPFQILKFRSMYVTETDGAIRQATRNDSRVTPVGRILRKTSLDELPQLINVLKGEMSLVGPRPHAVAHDEHYGRVVLGYRERFAAKPGLTGLAQVSGARGETPLTEDMQRRIDFDLRYVAQASPAMDAKILLKTVREVVGNTNAF